MSGRKTWLETRGSCFGRAQIRFRADACRASGKRTMKTHARVVVIGGGVVGVSTLYHLARKGWSDVMLLERTELTAGSTWHAAGLLPLFNMSYTVGQLHKYSVDLYKRAAGGDRTGRELPRHRQPAPRDDARPDGRILQVLRHGEHDRRAVPGHHPAEVKELWPLVNLGDGVDTPKIVGALYHPDDGHIAPVDLTMALRRARAPAAPRSASRPKCKASRARRRANGRSRPTRATSRASTSSAPPATTRARPAASSA